MLRVDEDNAEAGQEGSKGYVKESNEVERHFKIVVYLLSYADVGSIISSTVFLDCLLH